jgi:hypothetical protein
MANFNDDHVITLRVTANPKNPRNGATGGQARSWLRFNLYKDGMTVRQYKDAVAAAGVAVGPKGYAAADLIWDTEHGFIAVTAPGNVTSAPAPAPAVAAPAPAKATKGKRAKG